MEKLVFILICVVLSLYPNISYAQKDSISAQRDSIVNSQKNNIVIKKARLNSVYLNCGLGKPLFQGVVNNLLAGIGLNFILTNNMGANVSYNYFMNKARELPSNYQAGSFEFGKPVDYLNSYSVRILKVFPTSTKKFTYGIEGGLSMVDYNRAHFSPNNASISAFPLFSESNYVYSYTKSYSVGLSFRAKVAFPRILGVEIATISNINEFQSYVGIELHLTIGYSRDRSKASPHK